MSELDSVSRVILSLISQLDRVGAETWNLNHVAMVTTATILIIRGRLGQLHGIDWYAFMHALITGVGSILCLYLDVFAYDTLREGTYKRSHTTLCLCLLTSSIIPPRYSSFESRSMWRYTPYKPSSHLTCHYHGIFRF
jgi:cytochrome bd-type quinol oxidase subunit 1